MSSKTILIGSILAVAWLVSGLLGYLVAILSDRRYKDEFKIIMPGDNKTKILKESIILGFVTLILISIIYVNRWIDTMRNPNMLVKPYKRGDKVIIINRDEYKFGEITYINSDGLMGVQLFGRNTIIHCWPTELSKMMFIDYITMPSGFGKVPYLAAALMITIVILGIFHGMIQGDNSWVWFTLAPITFIVSSYLNFKGIVK